MATNPAGDRGRVAAWSGVLGIAVAVTGVLAVSTIGASADHLRHTPSLFGVSADFAVNAEVDDPDAAAEAAIGALLADPDVEAVASVLGLSTDSAEAHGPNGAAASVDPEALRHERGLIGPTIRSGRLATGSDEVVLGRATADALGAELGDRVTVTRVDESSVDYVVVGLAVSYGTDVVDEGFQLTEGGIERLAVPCGPDGGDEGSCVDAEVWTVVARAAPGADRDARRRSARRRRHGADPGSVHRRPLPRDRTGAVVPRRHARRPRGGRTDALVADGQSPPGARARDRQGSRVHAAAGGGRGPLAGCGDGGRRAVIGLAAGVLIGRIIWRHLATTIGVVVYVRLPAWAPVVAVAGVIVVVLAVTAFPSARARRARPAELLRTE